MIEFLPPRDDAFGERDVADFVGVDGDDTGWDDDEPPRSRWLTAVATLGVVGLLAGGVVAASPWSDGGEATPPSTVPATTVPAPSTTDATDPTVDTSDELPSWMDDSVPGYVLPDDSGFVATFAVSYTGFGWSGDAVDLWATPDSSRTTGTWLAVDSMASDGDFLTLYPDATRFEAGDATMLVRTDVDGVVHLVVDPPARTRFELVSRGITLDRLLAVAAGVDAGRTAIDYDPGLVAPDGTLEGLAFVHTTPVVADFGLTGGVPAAVTSYVDPDGGANLEVSLTELDPAARPVTDLIVGRPVDPTTLSDTARAGLAEMVGRGLDPVVRESTGAEGFGGSLKAVTWTSSGGNRVSVSGNVDVDTLVGAAARVELSTPEAWRALVRATAAGVDIPVPDDPGPTLVLADDVAGQWSAQVWDGWFGIYGPSYYASVRFDPPSGPHLQVFRSLDQAFVLITNTWPNDGLQVVVTQPGADAAPPLRLLQVGDRPVYAAVARVEPDVPFAVQWLDLDGNPVEGPAG